MNFLDQAEVWTGADGVPHRLDDMDRHHRANLIPFLRGNAFTLQSLHAPRTLLTETADDWLESTPLMRRLVELERGRPIDERRETFLRNQQHEAETGYQKVRLG